MVEADAYAEARRQSLDSSMKELNQLLNIATQVRRSEVYGYDDDKLTNLCLPVSRALLQALHAAGFKEAYLVQGTFTLDEPVAYEDGEIDKVLHYWVEYKDLIIDLTATQFAESCQEELENITMGTHSEYTRYSVSWRGKAAQESRKLNWQRNWPTNSIS